MASKSLVCEKSQQKKVKKFQKGAELIVNGIATKKNEKCFAVEKNGQQQQRQQQQYFGQQFLVNKNNIFKLFMFL